MTMACKICKRSSCTESFHSISEQMDHEESASRMADDLSDSLAECAKLKAQRDNAERSFIELADKLDQVKAQRDELADKLNAILFYMPEGWRNDGKAWPTGLISEAMELIRKLANRGKEGE